MCRINSSVIVGCKAPSNGRSCNHFDFLRAWVHVGKRRDSNERSPAPLVDSRTFCHESHYHTKVSRRRNSAQWPRRPVFILAQSNPQPQALTVFKVTSGNRPSLGDDLQDNLREFGVVSAKTSSRLIVNRHQRSTVFKQLHETACTRERATENLYAIDVPPSANIDEPMKSLKAANNKGSGTSRKVVAVKAKIKNCPTAYMLPDSFDSNRVTLT